MDVNVQGVLGPVGVKSPAESVGQRPESGRQLPDNNGSVVAPPRTEADVNSLADTVVSIQEFAQSIQRDLSFSVDDSSGRVVVEVRDQASGDVIRQIPTEEALRLLKHLEEARGLMLNTTA